ncbi:stAR-related lipid transfer protein 3 isoform X2 [Octopus bimaculoides]|uniref:stAR-related lipid transfer protein 3 isoform X2 n=1 Tax=Octopus bimaculoides TaxID=37653 RepID=UPI0022E84503|nr:stAR-related lipid transfer protein 3 isoform X2 [Octopus bimaculoides]XP_052822494.1 stAR-related lipid transfer protein 3 isoform X2 [Octopus bimaculoides]
MKNIVNKHMSNFATTSVEAEVGAEGPDGKMSPVRRTFCLIATFDIIFTVVIWIIYTQILSANNTHDSYNKEVLYYDIHYSMFDIVMSAAVRFVLLILAYALFRIRHWWMVAIATFLTCAFLIAKCLVFDFNYASNSLTYALLLVSFVICWIETWFLDFKVLPQEKRYLLRTLIPAISERTPLLRGNNPENPDAISTTDEFHSPIDSPASSDEEPMEGTNQYNETVHRQTLNNKTLMDLSYLKLGKDSWEQVYSLYKSESNWVFQCGKDATEGCVLSKKSNVGNKIFFLQAVLNISAKELWEDLVFRTEDLPTWNPTIADSKLIKPLSENCDISYYVAAPGAKGLVKSRDFVVVRKWGKRKGLYFSTGMSVKFPSIPPVDKCVRGENGAGGYLVEPLSTEPNKCKFYWFCNTNLKGMLPQKLVDSALGGMQLDYLKHLRHHVEQL